MAAAVQSVASDLASIVGESHVTSDPQACSAFSAGGANPCLAVFPRSAEEVAHILRYASTHGLAVIPCRNATKLGLGNPPRKYDIALSLKEMNSVWRYEPSDLTVSVEPGIKFGDFQRFVGRDSLWLPLDPEGGERASIGGILATNSAGPLRHAYGSPRDMTLGISVATTEGKVIKAGGQVVKNVAGYDLTKLLIGSFGTLGVIVRANFKLFPRPVGNLSFAIEVKTLEAARKVRRLLCATSLPIIRMVLAGPSAAANKETTLWVEISGSQKIMQRVRRELDAVAREAGVSAQERSEKEAAQFWQWICDFRKNIIQAHPEALFAKISLSVSSQEQFLARAQEEGSNEKARLAWACLSGVGIVHLALWDLQSREHTRRVQDHLRTAAVENGGTLVSVNGTTPALDDSWGNPAEDPSIMRTIKDAWDPNQILSPGRFAGGI